MEFTFGSSAIINHVDLLMNLQHNVDNCHHKFFRCFRRAWTFYEFSFWCISARNLMFLAQVLTNVIVTGRS